MFRTRISSLKNFFQNKKLSTAAASPAAGEVTEYSNAVKFFHWTMGGAMVASVGFVLAAQNTKDKDEKTKYMYYHKSCGLLAAGLLGPRLVVRLMSKGPGPIVGANAMEHLAGNLSHLAMYGFAIVLPVSGVIMGTFSGFGMPFFFTTIPSLRKEPAIAKQAFGIHKQAGQIFEYFIPLHVAGALYHVARGHTIFARIIGFGGAAKAVPKVK